ncbi:cellobiose phosphorylase [Algoriphagus ratkowskyi]|uniref:Cellobiose phosphorylase n=1 Tax=Algoriphagus ratkowskyi TaxID=57028 RepID=A0A2W7RHV7_9BACT|nr:glucoamylase family protein [Algoriphagus ratkowskyi]PZX60488.1 cellobiose phosphorylase [Algoriphagus ratkowskyi]TXD78292.1 cyclic beta 1-2 glucan synthetase [Algoriphagus ratkowskyi]
MKLKSNTVFEMLSSMREYFQKGNSFLNSNSSDPIRSELYNFNQMKAHAVIVAGSHQIWKGKREDKLLKRLDDNEKILVEVRNLLVESIQSGQSITPAAEWLLDNFYLIEEQIVIAKKHLPKKYSEGLPYLANGDSRGMPRVYDIAIEIISHSDGHVDSNGLRSFVSSYQTEKFLTLGELWAIPIMLKLAVIENLRRIAENTALDMIDNNLADYWSEQMIETVKKDPADLVLTISDMARSKPVLNSPFVAGFTRKLQGKGPTFALPISWLEQQLSKEGIAGADLVWNENQKQAADQVSVKNSIVTLRFIGSADWRKFVEVTSKVEQTLRKDITGIYTKLDFATRDRYRHVIESIAAHSSFSETEIAEKTIELTNQYPLSKDRFSREQHVGYFLIGKGLDQLRKESQMRPTFRQTLTSFMERRPVFIYLFSISILTLCISFGMLSVAWIYGDFSVSILLLVGALCLAGGIHLAISFTNWLATIWVKPRILPRLDFSKGIPVEYSTLVTIPTMLSSKNEIEENIEALEIRFLANREKNLYFSFLTDFTDADSETMPNDHLFVNIVKEKIQQLNVKYKLDGSPDIFYLFHRPRKWNPKENKWMGYERKRGKLSALNALLREGVSDDFSHTVGDFRVLKSIKYVLSLDSDTQLPREAAWKLIATMAHPLNHAVYDVRRKRVVEGYGILQPRVASDFPKNQTSLYLRLQGDMKGIDPYTRASSDVYQDIFEEGSFIGKGIYDVDIFENVLGNRFPQNRILSHDLLEGCYTRSGLVSDVVLYENNPSNYEADIKRHHRWIRGDWQIASWVLPFVRNASGKLVANNLSIISRWKIADNLRRSLLPISLLLILVLGWSILPKPWFWTLGVTIIILLPVMAAAFLQLFRRPEDLDFKAHITDVGNSVKDVLLRFMFGIAVLPYEAFRFTDAIFRTHWRMLVSGKKLLEWTPSATASSQSKNSLWFIAKKMWIGPVLAFLCLILFLNSNSPAFFVSIPILILWFLSPSLAWRLSLSEKERASNLNLDEKIFLRKTARKTWSFFEHFVNEGENWLPPDNFQKHPDPVVAHRTSPTNIGLSLLSNLTAYDFGYIVMDEVLLRCSNTIGTLHKMERFRGHFYNWYDTRTLSILKPAYVSTVDSGNLVGHLLILRQGILAFKSKPIFNVESYKGIHATLGIFQDLLKNQNSKEIEDLEILLVDAIRKKSNSLTMIKANLDEIATLSNKITEFDNHTEIGKWATNFKSQIKNIREDLYSHIPWLEMLPVPDTFATLSKMDENPSIIQLHEISVELVPLIEQYKKETNQEEDVEWLIRVESTLQKGLHYIPEKLRRFEVIAEELEQLSIVEYDFLLNKDTSHLSIGYNVDELRRDDSYYDMLASEARLGIFVGIAQGLLPQESWFSLGRLLTESKNGPVLLSWSGSMFEYLMPQLVMPTYENTLLHATNRAMVKRQIEYAAKRDVPWGISESGYNSVDTSLNYQYQAFGVPGLGLKRGLEDDVVIAPYATMLALMVSPKKATSNLKLLTELGFEGEYGFYEAIDYTKTRVPRGENHVVINSYMAHHQGMGFLSIAYVLVNKPMQHRFAAELRFQATLLLLQERIPRTSIFQAHTAKVTELLTSKTDSQLRIINTPNTSAPELQLLSNGNYQVMVTNSGGGYSRWRNIAVTRWREDAIKDNYGIYCYIKDVNSGHFWSNTHHPTLKPAKTYETIFSQGTIEFHRQDFGFETKTQIVVSPEDNVEIRKIKITNRSQVDKVLEITSYTEIVLATQASDEAHPAFSNLFVQTEIKREYNAIFGTRRPRSKDEIPPHLFHLMDVYGCEVEEISYETDRMQFIGRGRTLEHPLALDSRQLAGNEGAVLDPIMAIKYRITIKPFKTGTIDLIYGIGESRDASEALMNKYRDKNLKKRALDLSWTHSQVLLRQIDASEADAQLFGRLAASVIYSNPALRANESVIRSNFKGQSSLWSHSVSGDLPIVLLQIFDQENLSLVSQMIKAHGYWQLKGLTVDLMIWNEDHGSYRHELQDQIVGMISALNTITGHIPGKIYVKSTDQISSEDRILFESVAKIIINDSYGSLSDQVSGRFREIGSSPLLEVKPQVNAEIGVENVLLPSDMKFYNGTGGFTADGKEYKIQTDRNSSTPAPWVNIIANSIIGTVVSESGSAYTWAVNAHEYRISPWHNDPVTDNSGEAFYLRDEESGVFWSPSPFPARGEANYITTHGYGYTCYGHIENGIASTMKVFVDKVEPIKFVVITLKNKSNRLRKISSTGYMEIVLGNVRSKTNMHILSEHSVHNESLLFRNRYNDAFANRVAFFKLIGASKYSYSTDRSKFIGRNRNLSNPQALSRVDLRGRIGAGHDTCAALQGKFDLLPGEEREIAFLIGSGEDTNAVNQLIQKFSDLKTINHSFDEIKEYWNEIIDKVQVQTPDEALNVLANGWLTYQTIASRLFARSGFYQSGGAFGFRDQIQDVLSLLHNKPELAREQILLNASRQFKEGDVQHWWHPPEGRGVRTKCSDDLLWLPFVLYRYLNATGDTGILKEQTGFLESRPLHEGEDSLYDLPMSGSLIADLYHHCRLAIKHSLRFGEHGLPFMGSGDWNDGMDLVGNEGKGESVWLAFFFYDILLNFEEVANNYGDLEFATTCKQEAIQLQANIEKSAWDGEWYQRAWFDDGTPLGSKVNEECSIDAISQSWAVLTNAAPEDRRNQAMDSLYKYLVNRDMKIIQLLDPPFDKSDLNPGYIKGYVPGVRENGGQYSHAAIWTLMAFAALGDRERTYELFSMIQPVNHALNHEDVQIYKVEPYVMAADVYANETHRGRGGWTWYTGSAGWMNQFIIGSLLGMELQIDKLKFTPCFPEQWPSVTINYRYKTSTFCIQVFQNRNIESSWWKIGDEQGEGNEIQLKDDGKEYVIELHVLI